MPNVASMHTLQLHCSLRIQIPMVSSDQCRASYAGKASGYSNAAMHFDLYRQFVLLCVSDGKLLACRHAHSHLARQGLCSSSCGEEAPGHTDAGVQAGSAESNMAAWA